MTVRWIRGQEGCADCCRSSHTTLRRRRTIIWSRQRWSLTVASVHSFCLLRSVDHSCLTCQEYCMSRFRLPKLEETQFAWIKYWRSFHRLRPPFLKSKTCNLKMAVLLTTYKFQLSLSPECVFVYVTAAWWSVAAAGQPQQAEEGKEGQARHPSPQLPLRHWPPVPCRPEGCSGGGGSSRGRRGQGHECSAAMRQVQCLCACM